MSTLEIAAAVVFWLCVGGVAYAYLVYPILIGIFGVFVGRRREPPAEVEGQWPFVSVLIAAHNEEDVIAERIENALALDYPPHRLEVVVASDGSTDGTADLVRPLRNPRVRLIEFSDRRGKTRVLNEVIPTLPGEIVILSDANTSMAEDAARRFVRWFQRASVGVVVGRLILTDPATGRNVDSWYWRYETFLKWCEARLGALLGANGAVYAIRRRLFVPLPDTTLVDDLVLPLLMKLRSGCTIQYDTAIVAREETPGEIGDEFGRRSRIGAGGFQSLGVLAPLLSAEHGWTAFAFGSHKVLRWFCPFLMLGALVSNLLLLGREPYLLMLGGQLLFYGAASLGASVPGQSVPARLLRLATMFVAMNAALFVGFWKWVAGVGSGAWERTVRNRSSRGTFVPSPATTTGALAGVPGSMMASMPSVPTYITAIQVPRSVTASPPRVAAAPPRVTTASLRVSAVSAPVPVAPAAPPPPAPPPVSARPSVLSRWRARMVKPEPAYVPSLGRLITPAHVGSQTETPAEPKVRSITQVPAPPRPVTSQSANVDSTPVPEPAAPAPARMLVPPQVSAPSSRMVPPPVPVPPKPAAPPQVKVPPQISARSSFLSRWRARKVPTQEQTKAPAEVPTPSAASAPVSPVEVRAKVPVDAPVNAVTPPLPPRERAPKAPAVSTAPEVRGKAPAEAPVPQATPAPMTPVVARSEVPTEAPVPVKAPDVPIPGRLFTPAHVPVSAKAATPVQARVPVKPSDPVKAPDPAKAPAPVKASVPVPSSAPQPEPMLVVHLVNNLEIGGLEVVVANLVRHASPRLHQHVICLEGLGPIASRIESRDVKVEAIGDPGTPVLRSIRELRRRLKELRPDVLHTHNEKAHIRGALALLGWRGGPKLVHTRHGRSRVTGRKARMASRLATKRSAFLVSVSDDANLITLADGARYDRARVIRNGIDVQAFDASGYEERAGRMRAVMVSRLSPVKDVATMIRAAGIIANTHPEFHLDIVGDGPSRSMLEALRRLLRLTSNVTFHGAQNDVRPYLRDATLFVQSSTSEGISMTLLEAMAAGLPVVATDVGGTSEVVVKGETGTLIVPEAPDVLAKAVLNLLGDPATLVSMSRAARARAEQHFDVRQMTAAYEGLYEDAGQPSRR